MSRFESQTPDHILYKYNHLWTLQILEELVLAPFATVSRSGPFKIELSTKKGELTLRNLPLEDALEEVKNKQDWVKKRALKANPLDATPYPGGKLYKQIRSILQRAAPFPVGSKLDKYPIQQRSHYLAWASWYMGVRATWASDGQRMLKEARECMARFAYWLPVETQGTNIWDERSRQYEEHRNSQDDLLRELLTEQKEYLDFFAFERGIQEDALLK